MEQSGNPFSSVKQQLEVEGKTYSMYNITALGDERVQKLPFSIRVLLEAAVRNCDDFNVKRK
jgi:aconitate hydratase